MGWQEDYENEQIRLHGVGARDEEVVDEEPDDWTGAEDE